MQQARSIGNKGAAVLEILIAFAVMVLVMTAAIMVVFSNQSVGTDVQTNLEATAKAQAQLEAARALSRQDFSQVASIATTTDDIYQKGLGVTSIDSLTKQAISYVSWTEGGRQLFVRLSTILTNPAGNYSCNPQLTGDWKHPQYQLFYSDKDLISQATGNNSNGVGIASIAIYKGYLYLAAYSSANNGITFYVFKLPQYPNQVPVYKGSTDTALLGDVAVGTINSRTYAFVAKTNTFSTGQLQVIDVTDPINPTIVSTFKIPTSAVPNAGAGKSIYYANGYVYLGLTAASGGKEFNIIDVHTPTSPVWKGGYSTGTHDINSVYVSGTYAYFATPAGENMTVLDISNPANPTRVSGYTPPNGPDTEGVGSDHGESVWVLGNTAYVGRTYGTSELYALDATTPTSIGLLGGRDVGSGNQTSINGLTVRDHLAFALTNAQFQVWDVSDPQAIVPWSSDGTTNTFLSLGSIVGGNFNGTSGSGCGGDYLYDAMQVNGTSKDELLVVWPYLPSTYTLAASGNIAVVQGNSGSNTITEALTSGFPQTVTLTASGLPAGATASYTNNPCTVSCSNTLTVATTFPTTPAGTYPVTITGTNGVTTNFNLVVTSAFDYSIAAPSVTVSRGSQVNQVVTLTKSAGTAQAVSVSYSNVPSNVVVTPATQSCTPNGTCQLTFTIAAANNAQKKTTSVTVSGTSPSHSTTFNLTVQ